MRISGAISVKSKSKRATFRQWRSELVEQPRENNIAHLVWKAVLFCQCDYDLMMSSQKERVQQEAARPVVTGFVNFLVLTILTANRQGALLNHTPSLALHVVLLIRK